MAKQFFGQMGRLLPEKAGEYASLHQNPWPELLDILRKHHLGNYSIYQHGLWVFSYFEYDGQDYEADMASLEQEPVMQRWWTFSKPCFQRFSMGRHAEFYDDMDRIFYLE